MSERGESGGLGWGGGHSARTTEPGRHFRRSTTGMQPGEEGGLGELPCDFIFLFILNEKYLRS